MPLPLVEEIRDARQRHAEATVAHQLVHQLDHALLALEGWEPPQPLPGADLLVGFELRWRSTAGEAADLPPLADPPDAASARARLTAARDALVPLAQQEHELEHELEHLMYDQYQALSTAPEHAELFAVLQPLYDERAALTEELVPKADRQQLLASGLEMLATFAEYTEASAADHDPTDPKALAARRTLAIALSALETLRDTLPNFGLEGPYPDPPSVDHADSAAPGAEVLAEAERLAAELDAYRRREQGRCDALWAEVEVQHARWDELNQLIREQTG